MKIVSRAQQGYFGAIRSGTVKSKSISPAKATLMLDENRGKMRDLPDRAPARVAKRVSRRGGSR